VAVSFVAGATTTMETLRDPKPAVHLAGGQAIILYAERRVAVSKLMTFALYSQNPDNTILVFTS
jgi:hypothetical protein